MDKFTKLTAVAAPLNMINVDTDMIIPKDYLKTIKRTGLGIAGAAGRGVRCGGCRSFFFAIVSYYASHFVWGLCQTWRVGCETSGILLLAAGACR